MYTILGGDQQQYGPIDQAGVMQWIQNGQATAETMVFKQGSPQWVKLGTLPEFAGVLAGGVPGSYTAGVQPSKKSNVPKVFGILHVVFGTLCGLCCSIGLFGNLIDSPGPSGNDEPDAIALVLLGLFALTHLLLIIAGIGLLMYRSWGASLSIGYAIIAILLSLANMATAIFSPDNPFTNSVRGDGAEMAGFGFGIILALVLLVAYPIITLIFMRKQNVKDALN